MEKVIFIENKTALILNDTKYNNELELQELVKQYPNIIDVHSIFDSPLLIIGRESLRIDVLAITLSGVPVIIECKRKKNPDMRYLIAQVFEYASTLQSKSFRDFDNLAKYYFDGPRCLDKSLKGKSLIEAINTIASNDETNEVILDKDIQDTISSYLLQGEFYLVIVVDELDNTTRKTVDFLNSKLTNIRIDVLEIKKFSLESKSVYIPIHTNKETVINNRNTPGKTSIDELLSKASVRQNEIISIIIDHWSSFEFTSIEVGTAGLSLRYKVYSIFWLFSNRFHIANPFISQLKRNKIDTSLGEEIKLLFKNEFNNSNVFFNDKDVTPERIKILINNIIDKLNKLK